ncbi:MAG: hypothetical protein LV481_14175 [Methylacidiphilales bacterium]|nr:hypothetical protein [Candidatus Methylacidiphilales bacterium]
MTSENSPTNKSKKAFPTAYMEPPGEEKTGASSPSKPVAKESTLPAQENLSAFETALDQVKKFCEQEGLKHPLIPAGSLVLGCCEIPPFLSLKVELVTTWVMEARGERKDQLVLSLFLGDGGVYQVEVPSSLSDRLALLSSALQCNVVRQLPWLVKVRREPS